MKDPAVLFYTSDFLSGVTDLTMAERGQYITLLCLQHQKGHLTRKSIELALGKVSPDVMQKFEQDEDGAYYNKRMEEEAEKRRKFVSARQRNGALGGRPKKTDRLTDRFNLAKPKQNLMGNENINEIINKDYLNNIDNLCDKDNSDSIFSFPNTTTKKKKTNNHSSIIGTDEIQWSEEIKDEDQRNRLIFKFFRMYGNPDDDVYDFIAYNEARGWIGIGNENILKNEMTLERYVSRWCRSENVRFGRKESESL